MEHYQNSSVNSGILGNIDKLNIAFKLIGQNTSSYTSPVTYHIPELMETLNLNNTEAKNILLDMLGAFSPAMRKNIVPSIISYLEQRAFEKVKIGHHFSLPQIALILFYEGEKVTRKNSNDIAKKYGYSSGEKLYQIFTRFASRANRTGTEATLKKNRNKLKLFESVIPLLTSNAKLKAIAEMNSLKTAIEKGVEIKL